jgi:hypothetical protein
MAKAIETRRFDKPDEVLDMKARGRISIVKMADGTTRMHAIFEPGWVWEVDEKPLLGSPVVPDAPHRLLHRGWARRSDGRDPQCHDEHRPRRLLRDPSRHDALVEGNERVELVLFAPPEHAH